MYVYMYILITMNLCKYVREQSTYTCVNSFTASDLFTFTYVTSKVIHKHTQKSKCMLIHSPRTKGTTPLLHIHLGGTKIDQVSTFKFLGIHINDTLTWNSHIDHLIGKVSRSVNLFRRLSWFLPRSVLTLYLKSYILPCLDYCDVVWKSCTKNDSRRLQTLFNYDCRIALHRP